MTPKCSGPASVSLWRRAKSTMSRTSPRMRAARPAISRPASVVMTPLRPRSSSGMPRSFSISWICIDNAGWVTAHCSAALPKWPVRTTASKYLSCFSEIMDQDFLLISAFTTISPDGQSRASNNLPPRRRNPERGGEQTQAFGEFRAVPRRAERDAQGLRRIFSDGEGVAADHRKARAQQIGDKILPSPFGRQRQPDVMAGTAGGERKTFQRTRGELLAAGGFIADRGDDALGNAAL